MREYERIAKQMKLLAQQGNWQERNKLTPHFRKAYRSYDFGFQVGEEIESNAWHGNWQKAKIVKHDPDENNFFIRNEKGWEVVVPGFMLRHAQLEQVEVKGHVIA